MQKAHVWKPFKKIAAKFFMSASASFGVSTLQEKKMLLEMAVYPVNYIRRFEFWESSLGVLYNISRGLRSQRWDLNEVAAQRERGTCGREADEKSHSRHSKSPPIQLPEVSEGTIHSM